jgi:hypothetical protein
MYVFSVHSLHKLRKDGLEVLVEYLGATHILGVYIEVPKSPKNEC